MAPDTAHAIAFLGAAYVGPVVLPPRPDGSVLIANVLHRVLVVGNDPSRGEVRVKLAGKPEREDMPEVRKPVLMDLPIASGLYETTRMSEIWGRRDELVAELEEVTAHFNETGVNTDPPIVLELFRMDL